MSLPPTAMRAGRLLHGRRAFGENHELVKTSLREAIFYTFPLQLNILHVLLSSLSQITTPLGRVLCRWLTVVVSAQHMPGVVKTQKD